MKKILLTVIITLLVVTGILLLAHAIWGEGDCIFGDDDDKKECVKNEKHECGDKDYDKKKACCDKEHAGHALMMEELKTARVTFNEQLTDDEKVTIAGIKESFDDADHTKLCPEGKSKFMEEHKADFDALSAIAENHKDYLDGLYMKSHERMLAECKEHLTKVNDDEDDDEMEQEDGETAMKAAEKCPEAKTCMEATEKCKGEMTKEKEEKCKEEVEKKCEEEKKKCEEMEMKCMKECSDTFKIHFLLLDF